MPTLKQLFHEVPRSALHRIREEWSGGQETQPCRLVWTTPGSVWSADFTQPPSSIDGVFKRVLIVRDLASQCMLLAAPCEAESADAVVFHLRRLFNQHAPPLVLKSGSGKGDIHHCLTRALRPACPSLPKNDGCQPKRLRISSRENHVSVIVPEVLPSDLYADASHPLTQGYALFARQLFQHDDLR